MALQKTVSTNYGIDATYWKIVGIIVNWINNHAEIGVRGWQDNASRLAGNRCLMSKHYVWDGADFTLVNGGNNTAEAYAKLKTLAEWEGAIDV